jgi:hypothetical protein
MLTIVDIQQWFAISGADYVANRNPFCQRMRCLTSSLMTQVVLFGADHKSTTEATQYCGDFNANGFIDGLDFSSWNQRKR